MSGQNSLFLWHNNFALILSHIMYNEMLMYLSALLHPVEHLVNSTVIVLFFKFSVFFIPSLYYHKKSYSRILTHACLSKFLLFGTLGYSSNAPNLCFIWPSIKTKRGNHLTTLPSAKNYNDNSCPEKRLFNIKGSGAICLIALLSNLRTNFFTHICFWNRYSTYKCNQKYQEFLLYSNLPLLMKMHTLTFTWIYSLIYTHLSLPIYHKTCRNRSMGTDTYIGLYSYMLS